MAKLKLLVCGASGRVGSRVAELARSDPRFTLLGGLSHARALPNGLPTVAPAALASSAAASDVLIDFTLPAPALDHVRAAAKAGRAIVVGTTGFTPAQRAELERLAAKCPLFLSPNMSLSMNVMFELSALAAKWLPGYDAAIVEAHHSGKRDAPSGTALRLAKSVPGAPIQSIRAGAIVGDHTVLFAGPHDRLELTHRAEHRDAFAKGALEAAAWVARKKPGLYDFSDLLQ